MMTAVAVRYTYGMCTRRSDGGKAVIRPGGCLRVGRPWLIACLLLGVVSHAAAEEGVRHPLFKIERNKNANIVQYDAQTTSDGRLHHRQPVVAYWVRLASDGAKRKLNWLQRRFAYGFKARLDREANTVHMEMVADIGRPITVERYADAYRAVMRIGGMTCRVEKFFIDSSGKGLGTKVNFTEFFGTDVRTDEPCYEKLAP